MAKRGQLIDELYISLGLDIAKLQLDFDTAGKTVSQAISRLDSKASNIKLKLDIDLAKLEGAGNALDAIKAKYTAINQQLDIQRKKEEILANVLKEAQKNSGKDSAAARRAETNLLKQQRIVAQTEAQVRKLSAEMKKLGVETDKAGAKASSFGAKASAAFNKAKGGIGKLNEGFTLLNAKLAAVLAVVSTGAGLFTLTKGAMESGEATYRLSKRLHATAAEAGLLNRTFKLAGMDVATVIPLIARLDKQVSLAGESGNDTTRAMERFGISLLDQYGNLLPLNEQIVQLAKGYHNAAEMGQEEAYTAEVLGARGAALLPILEQYTDLAKIASSVKTTGLLNAEDAHQTWIQWKMMEMELSQLKSAVGAALLPMSKELLPEVTEGFKELVKIIADNKDTIKAAIQDWAGALKAVLGPLGSAVKTFGELTKHEGWLKETHPRASAVLNHTGIVGDFAAKLLYSNEYDQYLAQKKIADEKLQAEKAAAEAAEREAQRINADNAKVIAARAAAAKAETELTQKLDELTKNDLTNSIRAVYKEVDELKKKGADVKLIDEYKLAKQKKIFEDFQHNVIDAMDAINKTALEKRLQEIEKEKQAWIKKGVDEVKATEWAEQSKLDAKRNAALQVLQSQKEEFYAFLEGGEAGLADYYIQKHGFTPFDLETTPEEIAAFQKAQKSMLENILPNFRDPAVIEAEREERLNRPYAKINGQEYSYGEYLDARDEGLFRKLGEALRANERRGSDESYADNRQVTVNVNIENAVTQDNNGIRILADAVADKIRPEIENALGGDGNSYSNR